MGRPAATGVRPVSSATGALRGGRAGRHLRDEGEPAGSRPMASIARRIASRRSLKSSMFVVGLSGSDRRQDPAVGQRGRQRDAAALLAAEPDAAGRRAYAAGARWSPRRADRTGRPGHARAALAASAEHSARITCTADSNRSNRSRIGGSGIPNGTCSPSCQPAPEPEDEPPARDVVEDRRRLGQHRRVAERGRQHGVARATCRARGGRARPSGSTASRLGPCAIQRDVGQVVVHPDRLEHRRARRSAPSAHRASPSRRPGARS